MLADSDIPFLIRPMRMLLEEGKPLPPAAIIRVGEDRATAKPIGILSMHKLVYFWPAFPVGTEIGGERFPPKLDHVTLSPKTLEMHLTHFNKNRKRQHHPVRWQAQAFPDTGLAYWFSLFMKWSLIEQQKLLDGISATCPPTDKARRETEIARYANSLANIFIQCPPRHPEGDGLICVVYLVTDRNKPLDITTPMFPNAGMLDECFEGWPDGGFDLRGEEVTFGDRAVVVATACPPGQMREVANMGFPRPTSTKSLT